MRPRRTRRVLLTLALFVAFGIAAAFATGRLTVVVTHGVSMLPLFHTGDLVVLRTAAAYHVGEVVAYRSPMLDTTVLHRIVAEQNGLFSFKGDHNSWLDPQRLSAAAIKGTMLFHLPRVGLLFLWLHSPLHAAFAGALLCALGALVASRRRRATGRAKSGPRPSTVPRLGSRNWQLLAGGLSALLLGALTFAAYRVPLSTSTTETIPYSQQLTYAYSGSATRSAVYPNGSITTGDPIFVKLLHALIVKATYRLETTSPSSVRGTISLVATIAGSDGWTHNLLVAPPTPFVGPVASVQAALPVTEAVALVLRAASETGIGDGGDSIVLTSEVSAHGSIGGESFSDKLAPSLTFEMSPLEVSLLPDSTALGGRSFPQLQSSKSSTLQRELTTPREFTLLGHRVDVKAVRSFGSYGTALGIAVLLLGVLTGWRRRARSDEERTRRRVRRDLVPVDSDPALVCPNVVDISTMTALADLAERFDVVLLDYQHAGAHVYFAEVGEILYRFGQAPPVSAQPPEEAADPELGADVVVDDVLDDSLDREGETEVKAIPLPAVVQLVPPLAPEEGVDEETAGCVDNGAAEVAGAEIVELPVLIHLAPPVVSEDETEEEEEEEEEIGESAEGDAAGALELPSIALFVPRPRPGEDRALGLNAWFAEEKRREFLENPASVPDSWRRYFEQGDLGLASGNDA